MDSHTVLSGVADLAKSLLPPGAVAAVVSLVVGSWYNHRAETKLEESKSLMRQAEEQTKTRFSWLYENRAKAMMEIYGLAIKVEECIYRLLDTLGLDPSAESSTTIATRDREVRNSIEAFNEFYQPRRLIFSAEISDVLDNLSDLYKTVPRTFDEHLDPDVWEGEVYGAVEAVYENRPHTGDALRTLEAEFRKLYGSLDSPNALTN